MTLLGSGGLATELPAVKSVWCLMEAINQNQTEPKKLTLDQPTRGKAKALTQPPMADLKKLIAWNCSLISEDQV